jgi:Arc/MetJ-type ribon-helix-helix transcriptional regulator
MYMICMHTDDMPQLNMHLTPAFRRDLAQFMRLRKIESKSEAIRVAVEEALAAEKKKAAQAIADAKQREAIQGLLGLAKTWGPPDPNPKFLDDEEMFLKDSEIPAYRAAKAAREKKG